MASENEKRLDNLRRRSMIICPKCGKYTIYQDLDDNTKQTCLNARCGWTTEKKMNADIPREIREIANRRIEGGEA